MATTTDTSTYKFNHTMIRVKDPKESVKFYEFLGLKQIRKLQFPEAKFDLYFLAYDSPSAVSAGRSVFDREGVIELTHNYGTESDPDYKINNGNTDPHRGFGHTCISVDNLQAACQRIEDAGYKFQKKLTDGRMKHIAFALDPDGYWVEIIGQKPLEATADVTTTDVSTYRMNHTMLRVKDSEKSLKFYQEVMGMTLLRTAPSPAAKFTNFFLGYAAGNVSTPVHEADEGVTSTAYREGVLELTWNYGTESDPEFSYHDGNKEPQGFGHICVIVDDLDAACARFESLNVSWKKRLTDGRMKNVAFVLDPDGYWIEIVQNERLAGKENFDHAGVELVANTGGLEALLPRVVFLTIHTPLLATTLNFLGEAQLRSMKPTAQADEEPETAETVTPGDAGQDGQTCLLCKAAAIAAVGASSSNPIGATVLPNDIIEGHVSGKNIYIVRL